MLKKNENERNGSRDDLGHRSKMGPENKIEKKVRKMRE